MTSTGSGAGGPALGLFLDPFGRPARRGDFSSGLSDILALPSSVLLLRVENLLHLRHRPAPRRGGNLDRPARQGVEQVEGRVYRVVVLLDDLLRRVALQFGRLGVPF